VLYSPWSGARGGATQGWAGLLVVRLGKMDQGGGKNRLDSLLAPNASKLASPDEQE